MLRERGRSRSGGWGQSALVLIGCLFASAYFVHHTLNGTYGHRAYERLTSRAETAEQEASRLTGIRDRLARDVAALSSDPPGRDITEELARDMLGFHRPGEQTLNGR